MCQSVPGPRKPTEGCTSRDVTGVVGTDAFLARLHPANWVLIFGYEGWSILDCAYVISRKVLVSHQIYF